MRPTTITAIESSRRVPGKVPPPGTSPIADRIRERRGSRGITPLDAALLHAPAIADGWNSLLKAVRTMTALPPDVREAMILRIAAHNSAAFEWIQHEPVARDAGLDTAQLCAIRNVSSPSAIRGLDSLQAAALAFTDSSTKDVAVPDAVFDELQRQLRLWISTRDDDDKTDDASTDDRVHTMLVEAAAVVASYNMVSRFLVSLDVAGMADNVVPWPADRQEHKIPVPSCTLHAETLVVDPTYPWLIFANSLLTNTTMWSPVIPKFLSRGYNIILFDQRGHGRSSVPDPPNYAISDLADDIAVILDHLQIQRVHAVIGVSQGGATSLSFAIRHPNRTSRIIACDTQAKSPASNGPAWDARIHLAQTEGMRTLARATALRWFPTGSPYHPDGRRRFQVIDHMISHTDIVGFEAGAHALQKYNLVEAGLLHSEVRTLLIAGESDGVIPTTMAELRHHWSSQGGQVDCVIIPESGHLPMLDSPKQFWSAACSFLEAH